MCKNEFNFPNMIDEIINDLIKTGHLKEEERNYIFLSVHPKIMLMVNAGYKKGYDEAIRINLEETYKRGYEAGERGEAYHGQQCSCKKSKK